MKTFLVPFQEQETVWMSYQAKVQASCKNEAFETIKQMVEQNDSPHRAYDCINTNVVEHIANENKFFIDDFTDNDVKELDERICCEVSYCTMDFFNRGISKQSIINDATEKFKQIGLILEIEDFELKPLRIEEMFVKYDFIPTKYKRNFADGEIIYFENGVKTKTSLEKCSLQQINQKLEKYNLYAEISSFDNKYVGHISPIDNQKAFIFGSNVNLFEITAMEYIVSRAEYILEFGLSYPTSIEQLEILPNTKEKECLYNRSTCVEIPNYINIKEIEQRLLDAKSSVVRFKNNAYIVAKKDGDWSLWECEI